MQQIIDGKISPLAAAKEVGVHETTAYAWLKKYTRDPRGPKDPANALSGSGKQKPEDEESRKLHEKAKKLEAEVEFQKMCRRSFQGATGKVRGNSETTWHPHYLSCL